jgi:hypothetical protein
MLTARQPLANIRHLFWTRSHLKESIMKSRYVTPSLLLAGLITLASPAATASDELAGALVGAGAGAVIGHAIGGHDAAVVGGVLGAVVGASVADHDHRTVVHYRPRPYVVYRPAPVYYYAPPPYWSGPRYAPPPYWRHDRGGHPGRPWQHGRDGWRDDWRDDGPRHGRNR